MTINSAILSSTKTIHSAINGTSLPSSCFASGLLRRPLLFGTPVPKQTGQTSFPQTMNYKTISLIIIQAS
jgi:hypothetical protein